MRGSEPRAEPQLRGNRGAGAAGLQTPRAQEAARASPRDAGRPGSRRPSSPLSPRLSACGRIMKHFLPLCHRAPPSFSMDRLLGFFLGT